MKDNYQTYGYVFLFSLSDKPTDKLGYECE